MPTPGTVGAPEIKELFTITSQFQCYLTCSKVVVDVGVDSGGHEGVEVRITKVSRGETTSFVVQESLGNSLLIHACMRPPSQMK